MDVSWVTPQKDIQYSIQGHPYTKDGIEDLDFPSDFLERGRFPMFKEHFRLLKEKVGDELIIFGETEGPFTCAANLVGDRTVHEVDLQETGEC